MCTSPPHPHAPNTHAYLPLRTHAPPVPAAQPGTTSLSDILVGGEFRPRRLKLQLAADQEAPAIDFLEKAQACFKQLQECTISGTGASSHKTWVREELITVNSVLIRQKLRVLLE